LLKKCGEELLLDMFLTSGSFGHERIIFGRLHQSVSLKNIFDRIMGWLVQPVLPDTKCLKNGVFARVYDESITVESRIIV
jgi:hypothetical protein